MTAFLVVSIHADTVKHAFCRLGLEYYNGLIDSGVLTIKIKKASHVTVHGIVKSHQGLRIRALPRVL